MSCDFQTTTHGKWILVGEHAVLRGHGALVFPIAEKQLTLKYIQSPSPLSVVYEGEHGADTHLLFLSVLEQGMQLLGRSVHELQGHFTLESNIPVGVGMGASAALSVATARWFANMNLIPKQNVNAFSKELENLFHGQSSGLDIAGVAAQSGIHFQQGICTPIKQYWQPRWLLSSCGQLGITSHCIQKVQTLWQSDAITAEKIDRAMAESVTQAQQALEENTPNSQAQLAHAMKSAAHCFMQWGLVSEHLQQHMHELTNAGAIAVKPTGSGGGGYVVSLWESDPPKKMGVQLGRVDVGATAGRN